MPVRKKYVENLFIFSLLLVLCADEADVFAFAFSTVLRFIKCTSFVRERISLSVFILAENQR